MRFCSFSLDSKNRFGFELQEGRIVDLLEAGGELAARGELSTSQEELLDTPDLKSWFSQGAESVEVARRIGELMRVTDFIFRNQKRTAGGKGVAGLPSNPLLVGKLQISGADVIPDGVTSDGFTCSLWRQFLTALQHHVENG